MSGSIKDPRFPDDIKRKYPKHIALLNGPINRMVDKGFFYVWTVEKPQGKIMLYLALAVVVVIAFMLFNIWPLWLKIGIWYVSFYLLMVLVIKIVFLKCFHRLE
jgi:hypothetical protein